MTGENQESITEAGKRLELLQEERLELNTSLNHQWADLVSSVKSQVSVSIDDIPQVTQLSQNRLRSKQQWQLCRLHRNRLQMEKLP